MENNIPTIRSVYANIFESSLLSEIEEKSMLFTASAGQELLKMGQPIKVVPMVTFQHIGILSLEFHVDKLSRPLL